MKFGPDDYWRAALERLEDARVLSDRQQWCGAAYMAGRSVESLLRALLRTETTENEAGHDLRELLKQTGSLGVLRDQDQDALYHQVCLIAGVWRNGLRFADEQRFLRHLKALKKDRGLKGDPVAYWSKELLEACEAVFNRGEVVWTRYKTN